MRIRSQVDDTELERLLVNSARLDNIPAPTSVRRRILAVITPIAGAVGATELLTTTHALAVSTSKAVAGGATASAKLLSGALIVKCTIGGVCAGAIAVGAYHIAPPLLGLTRTTQTARHESEHRGVAPTHKMNTRSEGAVSEQVPLPEATSAAIAPSQAGATPQPTEGASRGTEPARTVSSGGADRVMLSTEVAALDRVRAALASGNGTLALNLLDEYQNSFRDGRMVPEATYLRVQALMKVGNRAAARDVAARARHVAR